MPNYSRLIIQAQPPCLELIGFKLPTMKSPSPTILQKLNRHRFPINCALVALTAFWQVTLPLQAANFYWDADGTDAGNDAVTGLNLGGTSNWDTSSNLWWNLSSMGSWPSTGNHTAIFTGAYPTLGLPVNNVVTLASGTTANQIQFLRSGYVLSGGDLTLSGPTPTLHANLGESASINSTLLGTDGLVKTGGGSIRLGGGSYSGVTTIANGTLIISSAGDLGEDASAISILTNNNTPLNNNLLGFTGGSLVLDGTSGGFDFTRNIDFEGRGPIGDRGSAIQSLGNNTLSGTLRSAISPLPLSPTPSIRNSRINSVNGTLTLSGTLNTGGTSASTFTSLGGVNTAGVGDFSLTGILAGTGSYEKSGAGTLYLNPSSTSGFGGTLRISASVTGQQSSVRVNQASIDGTSIFGTNTISGDDPSAIDMNGGILEFRNDGNLDFSVFAGGKNVYQRANSTFFVGPAESGAGVNGVTTLGTLRVAANTTGTFNSRNGFGVTLGVWTQESSNNPNVVTNNMGGTLTFTGNAWNNNDTSARTLTIGGNGNTTINGFINATVSAHTLSKTGSGLLTIRGQGTSTLTAVNVQGSLAITDFRSINNNTSNITLGNASTTAGNLIIGTDLTPTVAGLTTSRPIVLNTTTVSPSIYANQPGTNPVILNGAITRTTQTSGGLILGGSNTADNIINAGIPNAGTGGVTKVGTGTWVLAGANAYTSTTTIANGTLKLKANAATSTILPATNTITFGANSGFAGGTLEFVGQASVNNTQNLGTLNYASAGASTIKITPGASGSASLTFANVATGGAGTLNIVGADFTTNKVTITQVNAAAGADGILTRSIFWNGADYAYRQGGVLRAPNYGVDSGTSSTSSGPFTASSNSQMTGSFATNTVSVPTLKINGSHALTVNSGQTLTLSAGGLLSTGGIAELTGLGTLALGSQAFVVRVNLPTDELVISTGSLTGTGGLTKSGAGTLELAVANSRTGTTEIAEGTLRLSGTGTLSGANVTTNIRQGAVLDLNGVSTETSIGQFNNNGVVTNSSATAATIRLGNNNGTGTSYGIIQDGAGIINVTKSGTGGQSWLGSSTYTGVTTIGGTGLVTVNVLADGDVPSGIGAASNLASNLIFNGSTGGITYVGNRANGLLNLGSASASTDRLFTLAGTGATLSSTVSNNNAIVWSNRGAIAHGVTGPQTLILTGTSTGDNTFNPQLTDSGSGADITSLTKTAAGQWNLGNDSNTYSGLTTVNEGILALNDNGALPSSSHLLLAPSSATSVAVFQMSGTFERNLTSTPLVGTGDVSFGGTVASTTGGVGFAAHSTPLIVAIGGVGAPSALTWGSGGFVGTGAVQNLVLNSTSALSSVDFRNSIDLGAVARTINVLDNTNTGADYATMSGVLSGSGAGIIKIGSGVLRLTAANTYSGVTAVEAGTLVVSSLGSSMDAANTPTGVGLSGVTFDNNNALVLGNASTSGGILQYVGPGETSDRKIRLRGTTASNQIHADGSGPLILTNVVHDTTESGNKTLFLRGSNAGGNMITSQLSNNVSGVLGVTVDGGATWILTNGTNSYTGTTAVNGGALGIGHDTAIPATLTITNGNVFAYGGDRALTNTLNLGNNATSGFIGDYSLTFNGTNNLAASANNLNLYNSIASGKQLILNGLLANSITATRALAIDGTGETVINGNFTTSTGFGININQTGNGTLTLGTNGALSNWNQANNPLDVDRGILKFTADEAIPTSFGAASATTSASVPVSTTTFTVSSTVGLVAGQTFTGTNVPAGSRILSIDGPTTFTTTLAPTTAVASGVSLNFAASGGLTISPELATTDTATVDLNGTSQTVNALTATSDGTVVINNTSSLPAVFRFGANNSAVNFGSGLGSYSIQNTGTGALDIVKLGNTAVTFNSGVTVGNAGIIASEGGGAFTLAGPVTATSGLRVIDNSTLALTGGITNPGLIETIEVGAGSILNLLDGAGSAIANLNTLSLGNTGAGTATLNLNVGDGSTDILTLLTGGTLNLGNTITFNMTDAGLSPSTTYTLLNLTDGGLAAFGFGNIIQGATPGGFTAPTWTVTNNLVQITTGTLITGASYWNAGGALDNWNDVTNWSITDKTGSIPAVSIPGQGTDVIFIADNITGGAAITTTLEQNFKVNSLTFEASTNPADTPVSVTINPGVVTTSRLEIAPQLNTVGITLGAGGPAAVTLGGNLRLGADQTWTLADSSSLLTVVGSLLGEADVVKDGVGKVVLSSAADPTFNAGQTAAVTINNGNFEILNAGALGTTANSNLASITVNGGAFYLNSTTAATVPFPLTLAGGALSGGGANHTYSGTVNVSADSFINMADSNGPAANAARNITLSGVVSGSGNLTIDSNNGVSGGNQFNGTLTMNNAGNSWTGDLFFNEGTVTLSNAVSPSFTANDVTFNAFGRLNLQGLNAATLTRTGTLSYAAGAIGEVGIDNTGAVVNSDFLVDQNGSVTFGAGGVGASMRIFLADAFSKLNITGDVTLGGNSSISVGGDALGVATISSVISDGGNGYGLAINDDAGGWGSTNRVARLTGLNTFTGNVTLGEGILEFDTVTNISGGASSLGNGTAILTSGSGTLRFIGSSAQSTDRPITTAGGVLTLSANGVTELDTITYNGLITVGQTGDGSQIVLTGVAAREGIISGGIMQTGDAADATINGGTWTIETATSRIGDDLTVTGASTVLNLNSGLFQVRDDFTVTANAILNLNGAGVLSYNTTTLSADSTLRATNGGIINLGADNAVVVTEFDGLRIGVDAGGADAILNMGSFNQTVNEFILGNRNLDRAGIINGTGILTVTGNLDLYEGAIFANLASTGTIGLEKYGLETVTLAGDNSGLAATGATVIDEGTLVLDYTSSNTTKIRIASALDMRGANLILNGNASAATSQSVASFTLGSGGNSTITLNPNGGQDIALHLNAITRAVNSADGTVRFNLPAGTQTTTNGITTDTLNTTGTGANAIIGGWATVNDGTGVYFARNESNAADGNIVAATTTSQDVVTSWLTGENISDSSGFTGTLDSIYINSLRFNASSGSDLLLSNTGVLGVHSGGILVTDSVVGSPSISNGTLFSGAQASNVPEIIVIQDSLSVFEIGSDIRTNSTFTKSGFGPLLLSGNNVYTGTTDLQNGTLRLSGGNAIGDSSLVNIASNVNSTLELLDDETIGRLQGGNRGDGADLGMVIIGTNVLSINQTSNTTYAGRLTGSGSLVLSGTSTGNLNLTGVSSDFTGTMVANGGLFHLSGLGQLAASSITLNNTGSLLLDKNGTTGFTGAQILDTTPISLNSARGNGTVPAGLWIRRNASGTVSETVGLVAAESGASYVLAQHTATDAVTVLTASNVIRNNNATLSVRGGNMMATSARRAQFRIIAANEAAFIGTMIGGAGLAGSATTSIIPWVIGEDTLNVNAAATNMGNSLATYSVTTGFRPLNFTNEYATYATAGSTNNTREVLAGSDLTTLTGRTVNSLVLHNANLTATTRNLTGNGAGEALSVTSGALLFTLENTAAAGNYGINLSGFDAGISVGASNEYVFHVVNPSAAATTPVLTATISSPLISAADITKSGRGTLVLDQINTAGGGANKTTINEGILEIADLDNIGGATGGLVFAGGTLRLGSTFDELSDDISTRTNTFLLGGATLDTNGNDPVLAGSLGSGLGGFTKTGVGNLTLNATATYSGATVISNGTITIGADNALGNGGNLTVGAGSTLAFSGTNTLTHGLVTTSGASPAISGVGTISAANGFFFNNTGDIAVAAVLSGAGGIIKAQTNILTLTGLNTYRGTTEVLAGTLSFDSISNINAGPSALGNAANAENGIIRMGLSTTSATLTYTGSGHTTNRLIGMQGTTGGAVLDADGTGALIIGGVRTENAGNKTLTLRGSSLETLENSPGQIREVGAALSVLKTDANTWVYNQAQSYSGATIVDNGILRLNTAQVLTGALQFGSANSITTTGTLEVKEDASFGSLLVQPNGSANLVIDPTKEVTINRNVVIGSAAATSVTNFAATGGGDFTVNNTVNTGNTFVVGGTGSTNTTLADFSALPTMTVSLNPTAGTFLVSSTSGTNASGKAELRLADTTTITANALTVGGGGTFGGGADQVNLLKLGTVSNVLNVNSLNIGTGARDLGSITFLDTTGSVTVRAADGTSAVAFNMGTGSANTAVGLAGNQNTFDVAGHSADLKFSTVNIGTQNRNADLVNVFSFDTGTLEIGSLNASSKGSNGSTTTTTINLGGGTVTSGAWTLATASGAGNAVATANLTGGDITFSGNISRGADAAGGGTATGTVNLDGANLMMSGNNIGDATNQIVFNAMSGTLSGLNELNGGGALTKTTAGVLVMGAANAYTGPTNVNDGTMQVGVAGVGATGSGLVTVVKSAATYANASVISGSGMIQGAVVVGDIANAANKGILSPGDGTHLTSNATLTITAAGGLTVAAGSQTLLGLTTATGTDAAFAASGMTASAYLASLSSTSDGAVGTAPTAWFAQPSGGATDFLNLTNGAGTLTLGTNGGAAAAGEGIMSIFNNGLNLASLAPGQIFNLVDWYGAFSGGFNAGSTYSTGGINGDFDLPDIASTGYSWDVSAFTSHGVLAVSTGIIPEPSRAMLMLFGIMLLALRRRRNVA